MFRSVAHHCAVILQVCGVQVKNLEFTGQDIPRTGVIDSSTSRVYSIGDGGLESPLGHATNPLRLVIKTTLGFMPQYILREERLIAVIRD